MSKHTNMTIAITAAAAMWFSTAHAAVTTVGTWNLGENDGGATAGATANDPTTGINGGANLTRSGTPAYSSDTTTYAKSVGTLSVDFEDDNLEYYSTATVPSTQTTNWGIEAWVNTESLDGFDFVAANGSTGNQGWGLGQFNGSTWGIGHMGSTVPSSNVPIAIGKWQHVAIVNEAGTSRLYVDGALTGLTAGVPIAPSNSFTIGANANGAASGGIEGHFDGKIDSVNVFEFSGGAFDQAADLNVDNRALSGTAILGIHTVDNGTRGTDHSNAGSTTHINDNNLTTRVDTWAGSLDGSAEYDWIGVEWSSAQDHINAIRLYHATFDDGGWFGSDSAADAAPKVQYSTDGGTTWIDVTGVSTDYTSVLAGVGPSQGTAILRGAVDFTFDPLSGITGIRLFGTGGGAAGADGTGFISGFELMVFSVPAPAALPAGLAMLGLIAARRSRC